LIKETLMNDHWLQSLMQISGGDLYRVKREDC